MQRSFAMFILANYKFFSGEPDFLIIYQKNLALIKDSLKFPCFSSNWEEIVVQSPVDLKSLFSKRKIFLVWLISAYEHLVGINLNDFVTYNLN